VKIAILHHYSVTYGGGGEKILQSIYEELTKKGHKVYVYALPIRRGPNHKIMNSLKYYRETLLPKIEADVVYVFYAPLVMRMLFQVHSPKIAGIHSFLPCPSFALEPLKASDIMRYHGLLVTMATVMWKFYGHKDLCNYNALHIPNLLNPLKFIKKPVYTIPNWIDTKLFRPKVEKNSVFTVAFIGRPIWQKGWDVYEKIAEFFIKYKSIKDMNFIAVGNLTRKHDHIKLFGYISSDEELSRIYSSSHVVIYPSRADIFGITTLEALACGTPVLTSLLPSHAAFLPLNFLCRDVLCYIKKIYNFYRAWKKDRDLYNEISERVRKIALEFDKSKLFPKFENMLLEVSREV